VNKLPALTLSFWIMKIAATTLGETAGDLLAQTMKVGYLLSSLILIAIFMVALLAQLRAKSFQPWLYWTVILATSTAGTTMSDFMDRSLGLGYLSGSLILMAMLVAILTFWRLTGRSLDVTKVSGFWPEVLYWMTILISNTLGTALGDYLADSSGLGFAGGALLIGGLIALVIILHFTTKISGTALFWIAFVLTRPFGATFGDLMTKPLDHGGLNLGTMGASAVLLAILVGLILWSYRPKVAASNT